MEPSEQAAGRARGRGRGLYQHPAPFRAKEGQSVQREPWSLTTGPPRPPLPQPGRQVMGLKQTSSDDSSAKGRGAPKLPPTSGSDPTKRIKYPEGRPDNLRGTLRDSSHMNEALLYTRPKEIVSKVGTTGQPITCEANYFRLMKKPDWNVFQYRVDFEPEVHAEKFRRYLLGTKRDVFGGFLFDGTMLFLTRLLENDVYVFTAKGQSDETEYKITVRFTNIVDMYNSQFVQVMNIILRRAMDGLHLETVGRNKYDPAAAIDVKSLRLNIWPGYITSIRQHETDILLCAEVSFKIMRNETVLDILKRIRTEGRDVKTEATRIVLGMTVLTRYNNKTYRVDEIEWNVKPADTFKKRDTEISYIQYYQERYGLTIRDANQPMLVSNVKSKDLRGGMNQEVLLVPELCCATGITDEMRANFRSMREMSQYTKLSPAQRKERLLNFNRRLATSRESAETLNSWNLNMDPELVKIPARILPYPAICFGNDKKAQTNVRADWQSEFRNNSMFHTIELKRWFVITPSRCRKEAEDFVKALQKAGIGMRFAIGNPRIAEIANDTQTVLSQQLTDCANQNPQLIMCVVSNNQADRYATIKKRCYLDFGLPSQVMVAKTITPKDKSKGISGLLSVATKVAIQMNAKLGGLPWMIDIPLSGLMTIGYDVCHDPKNKNLSWGAMVATMDLKARNNQFFSAVNRHANGEEMSNYMKVNVAKAIHQFLEINGALPQKIMFYRDGVGEGQVRFVSETELETLKNAIKEVYRKHDKEEPPFIYIVVTKRVNTRIFFDGRNPDPGTCVDDVITLPERYDFYLIPQTVREGTVTPTGFNIIYDTFGLPPDRIQILAFRFTYFYFNWSGTVRVPAPCQYAHKLAFLASQSMQATPNNAGGRLLDQTLYFL